MTMGITVAVRNDELTAIRDAIDAGTAGKLKFLSGTRPATGGAETTVLAELTLSATSGTVSGGVLTFNAITTDTEGVAGTISWARITTSADVAVADLSVGTSGEDINLNTLTVATSSDVAVTSLTITAGNP